MQDDHIYYTTDGNAGTPARLWSNTFYTKPEMEAIYNDQKREGETFADFKKRLDVWDLKPNTYFYNQMKRLQGQK